ncbi:MAG: ABC transporter substrate-binding protein [Chloroflexi bacterium]|nr:ABC transporter substrate-binding protein [Chloroflexota bacterium]
MNEAEQRVTRRAALVSVLAMVAVGCTAPAAPSPTPAPPKATEVARPTATVQPQATTAPAANVAGKPEKTSLKIGLPVNSTIYLPIYLAADRTFQEEGLNVEVLSFDGGAGAAQALASGSVDLNANSLSGLLNLINAGQSVKGFYAGLNQADFEWLARPEIKSWVDLKGKRVAVTGYGGLTDFLTRHALRQHGLEPERDVQIIQAGAFANILSALKAGQADGAILPAPFKWQAEAEGFTRLGTEATEVAEVWPRAILAARERFLDENPNTVRALLRAHVKAIRLAKTDREAAIQALIKVLKYERQDSERAYEEVVASLDERGRLPTNSMPVVWQITVAAGEVTEPWPESRFLDRRFIDSFDEWAPR